MFILILGGTGAMGVPLVQQLAQEAKVYVTTRNYAPPPSPSWEIVISHTYKKC